MLDNAKIRRGMHAQAINERYTIRLKVLMLLLSMVMPVCHLRNLRARDSPQLPVHLGRFFLFNQPAGLLACLLSV